MTNKKPTREETHAYGKKFVKALVAGLRANATKPIDNLDEIIARVEGKKKKAT